MASPNEGGARQALRSIPAARNQQPPAPLQAQEAKRVISNAMARINEIAVAAGMQPVGSLVAVVTDSGATNTIAYPPAFKPFDGLLEVPPAVELFYNISNKLARAENPNVLLAQLQDMNVALDRAPEGPNKQKYRDLLQRLGSMITQKSVDRRSQLNDVSRIAVEIDTSILKDRCPGLALQTQLATATASREQLSKLVDELGEQLNKLSAAARNSRLDKGTIDAQQAELESVRGTLGRVEEQLRAQGAAQDLAAEASAGAIAEVQRNLAGARARVAGLEGDLAILREEKTAAERNRNAERAAKQAAIQNRNAAVAAQDRIRQQQGQAAAGAARNRNAAIAEKEIERLAKEAAQGVVAQLQAELAAARVAHPEQIAGIQSELRTAQDAVAALTAASAGKNVQIGTLTQELTVARETAARIGVLEQELAAARQTIARIGTLERDLAAARQGGARAEQLQEQLRQAQSERAAAVSQSDEITQQLTRLRAQSAAQDKAVQARLAELEKIKAALATLTAEKAEWEKAAGVKSKADVIALVRRIQELDEEVRAARKEAFTLKQAASRGAGGGSLLKPVTAAQVTAQGIGVSSLGGRAALTGESGKLGFSPLGAGRGGGGLSAATQQYANTLAGTQAAVASAEAVQGILGRNIEARAAVRGARLRIDKEKERLRLKKGTPYYTTLLQTRNIAEKPVAGPRPKGGYAPGDAPVVGLTDEEYKQALNELAKEEGIQGGGTRRNHKQKKAKQTRRR